MNGNENATEPETIATGNSDIEDSSTWAPPQGEPERPALPGHEHQHAGGVWNWLRGRVGRRDVGAEFDAVCDHAMTRFAQMVSECPPAFVGAERRS